MDELIFSHKKRKFFLFLGSYLLAFFIMLTLSLSGSSEGNSVAFIFSSFVLAGLIGFPLGLISFFLNEGVGDISQSEMDGYIFLGWIIYIILVWFGVLVDNKRISKIIYAVFVLFLIFNIIGCISN